MTRWHICTLLALFTLGIATAQADAISEARAAAAARGDWDAIERSYQTPQQRLQAKQEKAYEKLCKFQFFKHGDEVGQGSRVGREAGMCYQHGDAADRSCLCAETGCLQPLAELFR